MDKNHRSSTRTLPTPHSTPHSWLLVKLLGRFLKRDVKASVWVDRTQSLSFLLVIERLERARCATARETGILRAAAPQLLALNYCGREKKGTAWSLRLGWARRRVYLDVVEARRSRRKKCLSNALLLKVSDAIFLINKWWLCFLILPIVFQMPRHVLKTPQM